MTQRRRAFLRSCCFLFLLLTALLSTHAGVARSTIAGSISGRVTTATFLPIAGTVQAYDVNGDFWAATATVDGAGNYTLPLPPGTYAVLTQNTEGYINKIWNDVPCSAVCDVESITVIDVTTNPVTGIDFVLSPGTRISGTVTDSSSGLPIAGVTVFFADAHGQVPFTKGVTGVNGQYLTEGGTDTGTVYALTENELGYQNEAYDNVPCNNCNPIDDGGTPISVVLGVPKTGINFALAPGGRITGTVVDGVGAPRANINVNIVDAGGMFVDHALTDAAGHYSSGGLPAGTYFAGTYNEFGLVDQVFSGMLCPGGFCQFTRGTPLAVTVGATVANVNFTLVAGGTIGGAVTAAIGGAPVPLTSGNAGVNIYSATGQLIMLQNTDMAGLYTTPALPPGTYYAHVVNAPGFGNQLYNGISCQGCAVLAGTPIVVSAGGAATGINFALTATGSITGTVTNAAGGAAINAIGVQLFSSVGNSLGAVQTNAAGVYTFNGVAEGSYYVRTNGIGAFINEIYNDIPCQACVVTSSGASLVSVSPGQTTSGINFALSTGGRISGTVTNAGNGLPIQNVSVQLFSDTGVGMGQFNTNASGTYTTAGLPAGTYYLRTQNALGFVNKLYDNVSCPGTGCQPVDGAPVAVTLGVTTTNINFALAAGGRISGTATSDGGLPLFNMTVIVANVLNRTLSAVNTDFAGAYTTPALPDGDYYLRTFNTLGYIDERYDNQPCDFSCLPSGGTPITIAGGANQASKNFALAPGGAIGGTVRDAGTLAPLAGVNVGVYSHAGVLVKQQATAVNGSYVVAGLPPDTYHARTLNTTGRQDRIYDDLPFCSPNCLVIDGTPIVVQAGATTGNVNFDLPAGTEMLQNPGFSSGLASWSLFATPDNSYLVSRLVTGAFQYYRASPPPGTSNSAVILQNTGVGAPAGTGLLTQFDLNNTSDVRKRISVLVHDGDFSDLFVCTYWVPPNTPPRRYAMLTHPTKPWTNATISLYAASEGSQGGFYQLDNVTLQTVGTAPQRTECVDPHRPPIGAGPDGPELLTNGSFSTNDTTGWTLFGNIASQVAGGVFQFTRPLAGPATAGVILQPTGTAASTGDIYTARFDLGNSSAVRKRVTIIIHDLDFLDLSACTYWLDPGQPLFEYVMQSYASKPWTNATLSIYAATVGDEQWIRLDNASLKKTNGAVIAGTECHEPGAIVPNQMVGGSPFSTLRTASAPAPDGTVLSGTPAPLVLVTGDAGAGAWPLAGFSAISDVTGILYLDLRLSRRDDAARLEMSLDGEHWQTMAWIPPGAERLAVALDPMVLAAPRLRFRVVPDGNRD